MPTETDTTLAENLRECFKLYQQTIFWAISVSIVFFLFTPSMGTNRRVPVGYVDVSIDIAWLGALLLFVIIGAYGRFILNRALDIIHALRPKDELVSALLRYPSLATSSNELFRVGSVLVCPMIVVAGLVVETLREVHDNPPAEHPWMGMIGAGVLLISPYGLIIERIWRPLGSRSTAAKPEVAAEKKA